jgi:hypothetical protein
VTLGGTSSVSTAPPKAYQEVSRERFEAYERTGILPPVDASTDPDDSAEPAASAEPADVASSDAEPAGSPARSSDEH